MKTPEQNAKWSRIGAIAILTLIAVSIAFILSSCASHQAAVPYHEGLQREATFENRLDANESFTLKSLKEDNTALKKELKETEKLNGVNKKKKTVEEKNAELRAKIEEAKNNL